MTTNKTIDEILTKAFNDFYDYIIEKDIVKVAHEYSEKTVYKEAHQAITQAMLDALPEKYGLHIVKEMEELKEEIKNLHPSSNAYRDAERSRSMRMGRKVGFNEAIDQFESAIKLMGGEK